MLQYFKHPLWLVCSLVLLSCDQRKPEDYNYIDEFTISNVDGLTTRLRIPGGFWGGAKANHTYMTYDLPLKFWWDGETIEPYWKERAVLESKRLPDEIHYPIYHRAKGEIRIFPARSNSLERTKEERVLPKAISRDFPVVFGGLYWLGSGGTSDNVFPGRRFIKQIDGTITEHRSDYYYVPVDEENNPGFFIKCTGHPINFEEPGTCTINRPLTKHSYVRYSFHRGYLFDWRVLDQAMFEVLTTFVVSDSSELQMDKNQ